MNNVNKNNESGFGIVEILVLITLVALLASAGWMVYARQKQTSHKAAPTSTQSIEDQTAKIEDNLTKYSDDKLGIAFSYPKNWVIVKCEDKPKTLYLGSDNRGVGKSQGDSILCKGTDFPPQMRFQLMDKDFKYEGAGSATKVTVAGHPASKYTYLSDGTEYYPKGFEATTYVIESEKGILVASYNKWPKDSGNYDTSDESKAKFTELMESSLQLVDFF